MIIFPRQITAEQMGFSFELLVARIIFALARTFQNLEKTPKIYLPSIPSQNLVFLLILTAYSRIVKSRLGSKQAIHHCERNTQVTSSLTSQTRRAS